VFLRSYKRKKNGKWHEYFSVVENRKVANGKTVQRTVLYLGEITASQENTWRKTLKVFDADRGETQQRLLFADDTTIAESDIDSIKVKLSQMQLCRPRSFGDCCLGCELWQKLGLNEFWEDHLDDSRSDISRAKVLKLLVVNRLIHPGNEFYIHRQWFEETAMDELLNTDYRIAAKDGLYRCLDRILEHKGDLCKDPKSRWQDMFGIEFDVLLYDLTSKYFRAKDRAIRKYKLRKYMQGLAKLHKNCRNRDKLLQRLGALKQQAGKSVKCLDMTITPQGSKVTPESFRYSLNRDTYKKMILRDGMYLLRTNLTETSPDVIWQRYILLALVEGAFKSLKSDLSVRPVYHQLEHRLEAHLFVAFLAYCLTITLRQKLRHYAAGLTARDVLDKLSAIMMIDVRIPTSDGRIVQTQNLASPQL